MRICPEWLACFVVSTPSLELVQLSGSNDEHNLRLDDVDDGQLRATKRVKNLYNETDAFMWVSHSL